MPEAAANTPVPGPLGPYYALAASVPAASYVVIAPGSLQWKAWSDYFLRTYRRRPHVMDLREDGNCKAFAVPAEWPEHFDTGYAPRADDPDDWREAAQPAAPSYAPSYRRDEVAQRARDLAHAMRMQPDGRRARNGTTTIPRETADEALARLQREGSGGVVLSSSLTAQLAERQGQPARREEAA